MNTTFNTFPTSLLIEPSNPRAIETKALENTQHTVGDTPKAGLPWKVIGGLLVLIFTLALVGLWAWTCVEFVRLLMESVHQSNGVVLVLE